MYQYMIYRIADGERIPVGTIELDELDDDRARTVGSERYDVPPETVTAIVQSFHPGRTVS